ncbi:MAG: hypothetical protein D6752_03585 [Candidatus Nitrosothermus koennekii]|nr:MAG: hypothetical protein D6752_03585 [Candidatus Nitrosothermus koennekii]
MLPGALPVYQIQFFIKGKHRVDDTLLARTRHKKSRLSKKIVEVHWEGSYIADELNKDKELLELLKKVLIDEGDIFIDPVEDGVRIYGRWRPEYAIKISKDAIEAYNIIAKHVKERLY